MPFFCHKRTAGVFSRYVYLLLHERHKQRDICNINETDLQCSLCLPAITCETQRDICNINETDLQCSLCVQRCLWLRRKDRGRQSAKPQLTECEIWRTKTGTNRWEKLFKWCYEVSIHEADWMLIPQAIFSISDLFFRVKWWMNAMFPLPKSKQQEAESEK